MTRGGRVAWAIATLVFVVSSDVAPSADADTIDPYTPTVVKVGPPKGLAPSARGDGARTGRTTARLPASPSELWRRPFSTIEMVPVVDDQGDVIVATAAGDVIAVASTGKEAWRAHLQGGGPSAPPVILAGGAIAVVSTAGTLTILSRDGRTHATTSLGARGPDLIAPPVASHDGGLAIVAGRSLLTLDADGSITSETTLPMRTSTAPLPRRRGWLVVADDGSVYDVTPPKQAIRLGTFDGAIDGGGVLESDTSLLGTSSERVLAMNLGTGIVSTRVGIGAPQSIEGPITDARDGSLVFATTDGLVFGVDRAGTELFRGVIEHIAQSGTPPYGYAVVGGAVGVGFGAHGGPPLVVDGAGRVAFVRTTGRFGIVDPVGAGDANAKAGARVNVVSDHVCGTPIAVLPAGDGKIDVACREGLIVAFGE